MLEEDERFDVKTKTLRPFLKKFHKKVTDQGWNDDGNAQQIALSDITQNSDSVKIDITKAYDRINVAEL